jgi:DNA-binding transcriptional LysR family regulator
MRTKIWSRCLPPVKSKPRIAEEHDSVSSLIAAVEAGNGVAIAPQSLACTAGPRLKLIPFSPALAPLVIGVAWAKDGLTPVQAERLFGSNKERQTRGSFWNL